MEEGRLMWWGWVVWSEVVEGSRRLRTVEERQVQRRKQQRRGQLDEDKEFGNMTISERWACRTCGVVLRMTVGCGDCADAVRSTVKK